MPKWISIDEAAHKYGVKEEDICLWAEMEAITASFTETTLIIDEKSLQKFLCWHKTLPTKDYIHTLEQLCNNQSEVCKVHKTFGNQSTKEEINSLYNKIPPSR